MSWTLIEHQALTSSVASVTLGSGGTIPQTYKTLKVVISARSAQTGATTSSTAIYFNGNTTGYTERYLSGNGAAASSVTNTSVSENYIGEMPAANATASTFNNVEITIPNYAGSANKAYSVDSVQENNATTAYQVLVAPIWSNTAAITSITIRRYGGSFDIASGSTFTLYGLA